KCLLKECDEIVEKSEAEKHKTIMKPSVKKENCDDSKYFIESGDKIRYFYESEAFNEKRELIVNNQKSLNKIGHALHWLNPIFKKATFDEKVKNVAKILGFIDPVVPQSMIIFKNPKIGSEVPAHQDASFLYTTPNTKLIGYWIALEDATIENGCLWFIPKSHTEKLHTRFIRNPQKFPALIYTSEMPDFDANLFVAAPVKKGSCILIDGFVIHKSSANNSANSRRVYTFHVFDQHNAVWSPDNWLQPTTEVPFPHLYNDF
ncbi:hypothetical protein B4U80_04551, partial [Leptotrombidium deliense]